MSAPADLLTLPGGDLVAKGLADLRDRRESQESLLVASFASRLRRIGLEVPDHEVTEPEHRLYALLAEAHGDAAHGRYNALMARLVTLRPRPGPPRPCVTSTRRTACAG